MVIKLIDTNNECKINNNKILTHSFNSNSNHFLKFCVIIL